MALNKSELFSPEDQYLAELAKALAHPARIAILRELFRRNACVCGDLTDALPLAQATVSQHLKVLKVAGLIKGEIDGVRTCYCIDLEQWQKLIEVFSSFMNQSIQPNCC